MMSNSAHFNFAAGFEDQQLRACRDRVLLVNRIMADAQSHKGPIKQLYEDILKNGSVDAGWVMSNFPTAVQSLLLDKHILSYHPAKGTYSFQSKIMEHFIKENLATIIDQK